MHLARFSTLLLAALLASPALWHAFVVHDLGVTAGLLRLLLAVPVAAAMLAVVRSVTRRYDKPDREQPIRATVVTGEAMPARRATD